ncbi:hypothetical protein [Peribacillus frigoritolerans]|uniref:hypothetical protein n=1 Tax=Peribacillus frigoritolerans TaxID=450367 RepID=UPI003B8B23E8
MIRTGIPFKTSKQTSAELSVLHFTKVLCFTQTVGCGGEGTCLFFIDDNEDERSSKMLEDFSQEQNNVKLLASN